MSEETEKTKIEIKKLEVASKRLVFTKLAGGYKSALRGKGIEFKDFREYTIDDDASLIDWKATVRVNKPMIKTYMEERNLKVYLLIDMSSSMIFGSTQKLKNFYTYELAASLAFAILNVNDSLGFGLFTDKIIAHKQISKDKGNFNLLLKELVSHSDKGGNYDFINALKFVINTLPQNTVLIILSDFIGLNGDWEKTLKLASSRFDIIGMMIRDPRDRELPEEDFQVFISDPFSTHETLLSPTRMIKKQYKNYVLKQEKHIQDAFNEANADFIKLTTDKSFISPIIKFFNWRKDRWK